MTQAAQVCKKGCSFTRRTTPDAELKALGIDDVLDELITTILDPGQEPAVHVCFVARQVVFGSCTAAFTSTLRLFKDQLQVLKVLG